MRINSGYRRLREGGKSARMAGKEILEKGQETGINFAAYIRDKGQLAVQQLERMDSAYAEAVGSAFNTANRPMLGTYIATPLSEIRGMTPVSSYEAKGGMGPRTKEQASNLGGMAGDATVMAANFGARYALPGAGIALAAKGIGDVAFGGPSDQPEQNQLNVGNVAGMSAAGAGIAVAPGLVNKLRGKPVPGAATFGGMAALGAGGGALTSAIGQALF